MGLKKNSPGCNCCDYGTCLQQDARKWRGVVIDNATVLSATLNGHTSTIDPNADYLWAASDIPTLPATYRLGNLGHCEIRWFIETQSLGNLTGITIPWHCVTPSSSGTAEVTVNFINRLELSLLFYATTVTFRLGYAIGIYWGYTPTNQPSCANFVNISNTTIGGKTGPTANNIGCNVNNRLSRGIWTNTGLGDYIYEKTNNNSGGSMVLPATDTKSATIEAQGNQFKVFETAPGPVITTTTYTVTDTVVNGTNYSVDFDLIPE